MEFHPETILTGVNQLCFHLPGTTETQRNLADVNERYQTLGDKLADRKFELDDALEKGNLFRSELTGLQGWMDGVEGQLKQEIPQGLTAEDAARRLQEHKVYRLYKYIQ